MARRSTKAENTLFVLALIIGLPIYGISKIFETSGWVAPSLIVTGVLALIALYKYNKKQQRLAYLREKYKEEIIVRKIYDGYFWEGQTSEQLLDSLGSPEAVDNKLLKTKTKEIWKYNRQGVNRFALRITVENGYVVGWDKKA
ncbi:hypothetical protein [Stutzerimonas stutzeri]|uniref:hypothetical protein n=1 Tax=Stutzerimonas TaxID=2901164 RepID=UPI00201399B7|nr:hypothetical protein [Stutzerimonas stutzeri]